MINEFPKFTDADASLGLNEFIHIKYPWHLFGNNNMYHVIGEIAEHWVYIMFVTWNPLHQDDLTWAWKHLIYTIHKTICSKMYPG